MTHPIKAFFFFFFYLGSQIVTKIFRSSVEAVGVSDSRLRTA